MGTLSYIAGYVRLPIWACQRCGHQWLSQVTPLQARTCEQEHAHNSITPIVCAQCKNRSWQSKKSLPKSLRKESLT